MKLNEFFQTYPKVALAFSGGCDSAYLLAIAKKHGVNIKPYFVQSALQPQFELEDALRLGKELSIPITILTLNIFEDARIIANPSNRCYYCKQKIMNLIKEQSTTDGYSILIDGTNASDNSNDRPGMKASQELGILSPLRLCNVTKSEIRQCSKELNLFTWNKPAYACLATRIPTNQKLSAPLLKIIENAETELQKLGFKDFRIRIYHEAAQLQFPQKDMFRAIEQKEFIQQNLQPYFKLILLDLAGR